PFTKENEPNRKLSWYELKEMLFQAIKKQFRYVSPPVKSQIKRLSPAQLESVLDILPQFSDSQYLETHLTEVLSKPTPARNRDRFNPPGPLPERQFNREITPPAQLPQSDEGVEETELKEAESEPFPTRVVDGPVEFQSASEPVDDSVAFIPEPVQSLPVPEPAESYQPYTQRQPVRPVAPPSRMTPPPPPPPPSGVMRSAVPIVIEGKQLELVLEIDRFSDEKQKRGVRFSFSMDETQFLVAQLLTHRQHIHPLEPRVAEAIRSYFNEAEQALQGALQGVQKPAVAQPAAVPQPVEVSAPAPQVEPLVEVSPEPVPQPDPVQVDEPVTSSVVDAEPPAASAAPEADEPQTGKRHRRTNEELSAAGIAVSKRTRLTSEKIDLDSLKFDPRMASILSIDQARQLNIAPVSFLENSTDVLVLFVEPEGKVRIYTYFNRAANRAALAALVGIRPEKREQVKIRTFRVSQDFLNQFLDGAATAEPIADPAKPKRGRPAGSKNKPA
ncbi:MAG TPA: hypothetical protein PLL06_21815, partial [Acidobacteriota bacterium]|nr:hypothetical protein [Acidobacteriota bacterium]